MLNYLPSFKRAGQQADLSVHGFSNPIVKAVFDGLPRILNNDTFKNKSVITKYVLPKIRNQIIANAQKGLKDSLENTSSTMRKLLSHKIDSPVLNLDLIARIKSEESTIDEIKQTLNTVRNTSPDRSLPLYKKTVKGLRKYLSGEEEKLKKLRKEEANEKTTMPIDVSFIVDAIGNLNRVRIINRLTECKKINGLVDNTTARDLDGHEFAFELSTETVQAYLDMLYARAPSVCTKGVKKDCSNGTKISFPNPPKLYCTPKKSQGDGNLKTPCKIEFKGMQVDALLTAKADFILDVNLRKCHVSNSLCISFPKAQLKNTNFAIWLNDVFHVKSAQQNFSEAMQDIGEVDLAAAIPQDVKNSFTFSTPIIKPSLAVEHQNGSIILPMDLNPRSKRTILGGTLNTSLSTH